MEVWSSLKMTTTSINSKRSSVVPTSRSPDHVIWSSGYQDKSERLILSSSFSHLLFFSLSFRLSVIYSDDLSSSLSLIVSFLLSIFISFSLSLFLSFSHSLIVFFSASLFPSFSLSLFLFSVFMSFPPRFWRHLRRFRKLRQNLIHNSVALEHNARRSAAFAQEFLVRLCLRDPNCSENLTWHFENVAPNEFESIFRIAVAEWIHWHVRLRRCLVIHQISKVVSRRPGSDTDGTRNSCVHWSNGSCHFQSYVEKLTLAVSKVTSE